VIVANSWIEPLIGLVANALLGVGAYGIAGSLLGQPRGLARWLAAGVVFWMACTLGLEVLSAFGAIGVYPMLAWAGTIFAVGLAARWLGRGDVTEVRVKAPEAPLGWDAILSLALMLAAGLRLAIPSLFMAVKVVSDGPIYHLYFAARWWKAGRLILIATPFGENAATYFPANGDLWFTWLIASWGGEGLAKVGQVPFLLLAGAAAYGCARSVGAGRSVSLIATGWFVSESLLFLYSFEPNVDTIFIAGYLLAAYFFLQGVRGESSAGSPELFTNELGPHGEPPQPPLRKGGKERALSFPPLRRGGQGGWIRIAPGAYPIHSLTALVLGALAAGGAIGTKAVGVVFVPPLIVLALVAIGFQNVPRRVKFLRMAIVALVPAVSGGYWFARNAMLTGNPLYPLQVRLMGHTLWPGWYGPDAMRTSHYYLSVGRWRELVDILLGVLDPRLVPVWLAALAGAWAWRIPTRRVKTGSPVLAHGRVIGIFSILAVLNVVLYWLVIPYRTQQRFMLQALGLAVVPLAATFDCGRWIRYLGAILLAVHILTPSTWPLPAREAEIPWDLSPVIPNAINALFPLFPAWEPGAQARGGVVPAFQSMRFGVILAAVLLVWAWTRRAEITLRRWPTWRWTLAGFAAAIFLLLGFVDLGPAVFDARARFYPFSFPDFYFGWLDFESRCGPTGVRVAYAGTDLPYYFLGQGLRNEVRYVNIDRHRDWLLHDYHREAMARGEGTWPDSRPGWDRNRPDYHAWLENLDAEGIQLLVVTRANPDEGIHNIADGEGFPIEKAWADAHPERFQLLYGQSEEDPWFRLYRTIRSQGVRSR
jgi:hypothetical protein